MGDRMGSFVASNTMHILKEIDSQLNIRQSLYTILNRLKDWQKLKEDGLYTLFFPLL
jgi:hypothetical protein